MTKKSDWKVYDMPEENTTFTMEMALSDENIRWLKEGFLPRSMEDKWFTYYENNKYYFHRSWTGYCIYIVEIMNSTTIKVTVNKNEEQYGISEIEKEKKRAKKIIEHFARIA